MPGGRVVSPAAGSSTAIRLSSSFSWACASSLGMLVGAGTAKKGAARSPRGGRGVIILGRPAERGSGLGR